MKEDAMGGTSGTQKAEQECIKDFVNNLKVITT